MTRLNIDFLINTSIENILLNIETIFENLLNEIKSYLNLDLTFSIIKIIYNGNNEISDDLNEDFFKIGVKKIQKDNSLTIYISKEHKKFIRIILLREAYKCFIPVVLQKNKFINIFVNQKVEIDLQNSNYLEDWKNLHRKSVISYDFLEEEFDRLEKFLKQKSVENQLSPFQFFFSYIRKNVQMIEEIKTNFYDMIFEEYVLKYTTYSDEILETIRIITKIFYEVKSYRSLMDYQKHFKEFKENGLIKTYLSLRKFTENMQWIKNFSTIAPNYQVNWLTLNVMSIICIMKFHPIIETIKIHEVINLLPFFIWPNYSKNDFGLNIIGYFFIPQVYLKNLVSFLEKLKENGYLIEKQLYIIKNPGYTTNLNIFSSRSPLLNPNKQSYNKKFELNFDFEYGDGSFKERLQLLDWLIIDRIRYFSVTGLGFERRTETLNTLKSDLINEVQSQRSLINEIIKNLIVIHNSSTLRTNFLEFIENNESYGFFYIKRILKNFLTIFELIHKELSENPSIKNNLQFQEFYNSLGISRSIEDNLMLKQFKKSILRENFTFFSNSIDNIEEKLEDYRKFYKLFKSFYDLKIFNLKSIKLIIEDKNLIQMIFQSKEAKLKKSYEGYKVYNITNQVVEQKLDDFINNNPQIIKPALTSTIAIAPFTRYFLCCILRNTSQVKEGIEKIKWLFPRVNIVEMLEYNTKEKFIYFLIQMPNLLLKEKEYLFSVLNNLFKKEVIRIKSFRYSGFQEAYSRKDFYDFEKEDFLFTKDLFEQFYIYLVNTFNITLKPIFESSSEIIGDLWSKKISTSTLINEIENRISKESFNPKLMNLKRLLSYHSNLKDYLLDIEKFKQSKSEIFFKKHIKSIKIIPLFQSFGLGQYFLYFYPLDSTQIDFQHLLHNSFQNIKFPASIDKSNSFLIKFIWPFRNPNVSLINWLIKSKRVIRESCLFLVKKVFQIFHFNYNLSVNGWDLDSNRFKIYFQNVLFNPNYNLPISELKEFDIGDSNVSNYFTPESSEYKALINLYNWNSIDLKSYLGTRNYSMVNPTIELLEKELIFPIISVKNMDLLENIYIILPDIKREYIQKILDIFSFFNIGFIYEIEGEYYIHGFPEEKKFEKGLMIKLFLPDCQLNEFEKLFDLIFKYLEIEHYVVLNNLIDGKNLLKSIYGSLDFLKSYNPLKNLIWNDKDKIWMNHKLFTNKFEKVYPPLDM